MTGQEIMEWIIKNHAEIFTVYVENGGSPAPGEIGFKYIKDENGDYVLAVVIS